MLFIFSGLMFWGCNADPAELITPEVVIEAENPDYAIIRSLGFSTKDIIDTGDTYIVEGDVLFDKKDIQNLAPETRQTRTQYLVSATNVKNIKVYINPELNTGGNSWYQAAVDCLTEWNNIPQSQVKFFLTTNSSGANVKVQRYKGSDMPSNTIAWAYLPTKDGKAGTPVEISPNYDYYNADQKKFIMVHEFGHVLGLGHTDDRSLALIPGTPVNDYYSVMQSATGGLPWSLYPFTNSDMAAIQALYGIPVWSMSIDGPSTYSFSPPSVYTLIVGTNLIDQSVLWYINGVLQTSSSSFTITPTFKQSGSNTLTARINYGGISYEANKVVTVPTVPAPVLTASALEGNYGDVITISAAYSPYGHAYEWSAWGDMDPIGKPTYTPITITLRKPGPGEACMMMATVKCRHIYMGTYSAWTTITIRINDFLNPIWEPGPVF